MSGCDHSDDLVEVFSGGVADVASDVSEGVLLELTPDEIAVYLEGVDEECAISMLQRVTDFLQEM